MDQVNRDWWMKGCRKMLPPPPVDGMAPTLIAGVVVWVKPLIGDAPARGRRQGHRVMAQCPECKKVMSAGRLHQHLPIHA